MRVIFFGLLMVLASHAQATEKRDFLNEIICQAKGHLFFVAGQSPKQNYVDAVLYLRLAAINDVVVAESYGGHIALNTWLEDDKIPSAPSTYGIFAGENLASNPKFKGNVYTNHIQFREFTEVQGFGHETGMNGYLVVNKAALRDLKYDEKQEAKPFDANYVFQSGDHVGGTIRFSCRYTD